MNFKCLQQILLLLILSIVFEHAAAQPEATVRRRDRRRDVEIETTAGVIRFRLSDSTPGHRDNFLKLVKTRYYHGILFHRVIAGFVIQAGDSATRQPPLSGSLSPYTIGAEIHPALYHRRGVLAGARMGDDVNPERRSSGVQFYIVQGRTFTDSGLDSVELRRLQGRKILPERREVYRTVGGTPQLDGAYTVFGEVVEGMEVVDRIAAMPTGKEGVLRDRPVEDVRILGTRLVKRKKGRG
jgi:cyclophilin family peptidyl-prolyl cis-trans isomerase